VDGEMAAACMARKQEVLEIEKEKHVM